MRIVVLFNLKPGVDRQAYEAWAMTTDIPVVNGLDSVSGFSVHAATGLLGSDGKPPYAYIEVIDIADMDQFGKDIADATMQRVAQEFQALADSPLFVMTRTLGAGA